MPRIAAADIAGTLPVMKASHHLPLAGGSHVIDAVVQQLGLGSDGCPLPSRGFYQREGRGFAVVGYGKLAAWELGYSSILTLSSSTIAQWMR
ncbi:hypothetical protein ACNKHR_17415 [Shigella flexneri]